MYFENLGDTLGALILTKLKIWNKTSLAVKQYLFVIVIADCRATLLVIDQIAETVTFFDSHPHDPHYGCCIAQTKLSNLQSLSRWIGNLYREFYHSSPTCFELSFFQVKQK